MNTFEIEVRDIKGFSSNKIYYFNELCKNVISSEFHNGRVTENYFAPDDGVDGYYYDKNGKKVLLQLKNKRVKIKELNKEIKKSTIKKHLEKGGDYHLITNTELVGDKKEQLITEARKSIIGKDIGNIKVWDANDLASIINRNIALRTRYFKEFKNNICFKTIDEPLENLWKNAAERKLKDILKDKKDKWKI